jgi:hypothetical protein
MNVARLCVRAVSTKSPCARRRLHNQAVNLNARQTGATPWRARLSVHVKAASAKWRAWLFVVLT